MKIGKPVCFLPLLALISPFAVVQAQLIPDSTLGNENSRVTPIDQLNDRIDGGARRGANLFQSFREFNVGEGRGVDFSNPAGITNILTRVTGLNPSEILGRLGVLGEANLFLINPNGIFFGPNASLDIRGSFVATTADGIQLGENGVFSATNPQGSTLLAVQPSAIFANALANHLGTIQVQGNLAINSGQTLTLLGGDVSINGGKLNAPGGRIELGGLAGAGIVGLVLDGNTISLSFPTDSQLANVTLAEDARVSVRGVGGGNIFVNANIFTATDGGRLVAGTEGTGDGGNITVKASEIQFAGVGANEAGSGLYNQVLPDSTGNAGNVTVEANTLELTNGAQLSASTFGQGDAGKVTITAETVRFDGQGSNFSSGAFSTVESKAIGNAGGIEIKAGTLELTNGAQLSASTFGQGNAGSVTITAETVRFDGQGSDFSSGAFSTVESKAIGNAGGIEIKAGILELTNGGELSASTFGQGDAGKVTITAETVRFDGQGSNFSSGAFSTVESKAIGNAGGIEIKAGTLELSNGAKLNASSYGVGNAGTVKIQARQSVMFDGLSGAGSVVGEGAVGDAGGIEIITGSLSATDGSEINASTFGVGDAGMVKITASERVLLDGGFARSQVVETGQGKAGGIEIATPVLEVKNGAQLSASTFGVGNAGTVKIQARQSVMFDGLSGAGSVVGEGAVGDAGGIEIITGSLSATDGSQISASLLRGAQGNAGTVKITATDTVTFDGGLAESTVAETAQGKAGGIEIATPVLEVKNGGSLNASTFGVGDAGTLQITATERVLFDGSFAFNQVTPTARGKAGGIEITTPLLEVKNGAELTVNTFGEGDAGTLKITATDRVLFDGGFARSQVADTGQGKAGGIEIATPVLEVKNGGQLTASTLGVGDAGMVKITASERVLLDDGFAFSQVAETGQGKAGGIEIATPVLEVKNGGILSASTFGVGDAGRVTITAETVRFDGQSSDFSTGAFSTVESKAVGNAGGIEIKADTLELTNGAQLNASTLGQGDAGKVTITAETVRFDGQSSDFSTGAFSGVDSKAVGNAGGIEIEADTLELTNGAQLTASTFGQGNAGGIEIEAGILELSNVALLDASTLGQGDAGNIIIKANSLTATGGAHIQSGTVSSGKAGDINLHIADSLNLADSEILASTTPNSTGDGGNIFVDPVQVALTDGSQIAVNSEGQGNGGNIILAADNLSLDNNSAISAATASNQGGNISLTVQDPLVLRRNSQITATAGTAQGLGDGGNININAPFVLAVPQEDSDITANAFKGKGGNINITTQGIFGIEPRAQQTDLSDITASSEFGVQGVITISNPNADPTANIITLPANFIDAAKLIAQNLCALEDGKIAGGSSFVITGKGGMPPNPSEPLTPEAGMVEWTTRSPKEKKAPVIIRQRPQSQNQPTQREIRQAQGWTIKPDGTVILTAEASQTTPQPPGLSHPQCQNQAPVAK